MLDIQESNLLENLVSGNSLFISSLNSTHVYVQWNPGVNISSRFLFAEGQMKLIQVRFSGSNTFRAASAT